ncbi:MAG: hypothetical protein BGO25_13775 [Acidobacteriales bacterium 59-55]|nr:MAG: hypothetical protein BGO25_13775 [Acidobacteriales bacterium 59-55]
MRRQRTAAAATTTAIAKFKMFEQTSGIAQSLWKGLVPLSHFVESEPDDSEKRLLVTHPHKLPKRMI